MFNLPRGSERDFGAIVEHGRKHLTETARRIERSFEPLEIGCFEDENEHRVAHCLATMVVKRK